ncbi:hypothetical protein KIW84_021224 [Lathyrus oleraceus]|uniref:Bifunctional inhibitor/plant lipid transfer protein/seed storage helical domain-containing protein n=1 Tax=Pisum sativum TaxID=3888 RepID=A0A9D4Y775_PEA|nr:hypothetical protein KIW84_021224 [Pisum sativum]
MPLCSGSNHHSLFQHSKRSRRLVQNMCSGCFKGDSLFGFCDGEAPTPKKECCDAAKSIKDTYPECLCYIIQQTHKGSPESKSMGIQEDKLLQLPAVCDVKANISDCPTRFNCSRRKYFS